MGHGPGHEQECPSKARAAVAPVTRSSGKSTSTLHRRIHNRRLGEAVIRWGVTLVLHSPAAKTRYRVKRDGGDAHCGAMRKVLAPYLTALYACLRDGRCYDEARFVADRPALKQAMVDSGTRPLSKYDALTQLFEGQWPKPATLTFAEIHRIIPGGLPPSAYNHSGWWISRDQQTSTQARAWDRSGYRVEAADMTHQRVRFEPITPRVSGD